MPVTCGRRAWAESGVVALTGRADGPPLVPPGDAALLARSLGARYRTLTGVDIDGARLLSERAFFTSGRRQGPISVGGACRLLPTADGWAAVSCARPGDPDLLRALTCAEAGGDLWPIVAHWLSDHTGAELLARAALLGVAAGPVPAGPCAGAASLPELPSAPGRDLAGALVVDFSALWAGPLCAHLLGLAGARVVKVETPQRPDGARHGSPEFYRLLHGGHQSVVLDPATTSGREVLARLVAAADVVIEASRPRALRRWGLHAEAATARGTTWVSITAYGRSVDRVGFGDDVAACTGLVAREPDGTPLFCGDAIADPLTGLAAALLAAGAPQGTLIDLPMSAFIAASLATGTPATPARRAHGTWTIDTPAGPVPVAAPARPTDRTPSAPSVGALPAQADRTPAEAPSSGADTAAILRELGL